MSAFTNAVTHTLQLEGGYVNDPNDPGGETKYGISKRAYPQVDIRNLTLEKATTIYFNDYWTKIRGDSLPLGLSRVVFDMAVNAGPYQAIRLLQKVVGVKQDGVLGEKTLAAVGDKAASGWSGRRALVRDYSTERILFYSKLGGWEHYSRGWTKRVMATFQRALGDLG